MTKVFEIPLCDASPEVLEELQAKFPDAVLRIEAELERAAPTDSPAEQLLPETVFWQIIDNIDWSKKAAEDKLQPAVKMLTAMPVSAIYLFADKLSEKLYQLDTKKHAQAYSASEPDDFLSADDFLYARCAVVAEGREYYEKVLEDPAQMPDDIVFEPLLGLADHAYQLKTGSDFNYRPTFNYETQSNKAAWN